MRSIFVGLAVCSYVRHTQTALATTPIEMSRYIGGINRSTTNFEVGADRISSTIGTINITMRNDSFSSVLATGLSVGKNGISMQHTASMQEK